MILSGRTTDTRPARPATGAHCAPATAVLRRLAFPAFRGFMALLAMLLFCAPAVATAPPAGTAIDNTASLSATAQTQTQTLASNSVRTTVQGIDSFTLVENHTKSAIPGTQITLSHLLTNTGNTVSSYTLTLANLTGDGYDIDSLTLYRNMDNSGVRSGADPIVPQGGSITLIPGEVATLIITGTVPAATAPGLTANIKITAVSTGNSVSNTDAVTTLSSTPPTITFYWDGTFSRTTAASPIGSPLYVQANAPGCNKDPLHVEIQTITLTSTLTGDVETFSAVETGPNTGIFRAVRDPNANPLDYGIPTRNSATPSPGNHIVEEQKNDTITATIQGCGSASVETQLFIDPMGVLFDSRHANTLVAGASVTLIDVTGQGNGGNAGGPAKVFALDGVTPAPSTLTTAADGLFQFPLVAPSTYQLKIVPPNGYKFPSVVPQAQLPAGYTIDSSGSYGGIFQVSAANDFVRFDVPLDPGPLGGLFIEKSASVAIAEIGDFVDYTISVKNGTGKQLTGVTVTDNLPRGFTYLPGSARQDGKPIRDPAGGLGPRLTFSLGTIDGEKDKNIILTYRLKIGAGASEGNGINRAQATSANGARSNVAKALVKVVGGVFSDKGFIIGKVFLDCNRNRVQDPTELGIPGVRIYMEDGTFAITDSEGKYSLYNISPRTHVLKVDTTTLPPGSELITLSNRNAGDAGSLFVDMKNGDIFKGNFAEGSCNTTVMKDVKARRAKGDGTGAEIDRTLAAPLTFPTAATAVADARGLPSSGLVGATPVGTAPPPGLAPAQPPVSASGQKAAAPAKAVSVDKEDPPAKVSTMEDDLASADNSLGFLNLTDKEVLPDDQATIRIKGPAGGALKLLVNGAEVSGKQMGIKTIISERRLEAREYVAIGLKPGVNELQVLLIDPFGNRRGERTIHVTAPGKLAKITLVLPTQKVYADGVTPLAVKVSLLDEQGNPLTAKTVVTLDSSLGKWDATDIDEKEPGLQVAVRGGHALFKLKPPADPGEAVIKIGQGKVKAETKIYFYPHLRPMIAAGLVEGTINLRNLGSSLVPARAQDGFEQELSTFSMESGDGKTQMGARGALFLKGKIKGDCLLTLSYDSDKDNQEALFRDTQPDQFYPVYGDSSVKGFDAQSTGKLYVRVDKNKSYLLYGDFNTSATPDVRVLGAYNRSLNGLRGHYEDDRFNVNAFASRDSSQQVIDEIPAMGISGPYFLSKSGFVPNSEKVEIITRNRTQHSLVMKSMLQTRFTDYEIDNVTGAILFKFPVPTLDPNLNPNYIRVTYEVDQGGEQFWVTGVDAQIKLTKNVEVGGSYARDENPQNKFELMSANSRIKLLDKTYLIGEWAETANENGGRGSAERVELRHDSDRVQAKVYGVVTDRNFNNPNSTLNQGRREAGAKIAFKATSSVTVNAEALHSEDLKAGGKLDGFLMTIQKTFGKWLKAELGFRHSKETATPYQAPLPPPPPQLAKVPITTVVAPNEVTSLRTMLTGKIPQFPKLSVSGEYEQSLEYGDRRMAAGGLEYQMTKNCKLYGRHEFISSLNGDYNLNNAQQQNTTKVGIDTEYMKDGKMFSEYRVRDAIEGRDAEAAIGLKNGWQIAKGIKVNTSLERIQQLDTTQLMDTTATAVTAALQYTASPLLKGTARVEARYSSTNNVYLNTVGAAYKLSRNVTLLGRQYLSYTDNKGASPNIVQERVQAGFAYRPTDTDIWNLLTRYEFKYEKNSAPTAVGATPAAGAATGTGINRTVHIVSSHLNLQPMRDLTMSARYAGKIVTEDSVTLPTSRSITHMLSGRTIYDLTSKWDLGVNYSALFNDLFKSCRYGVGGEVGYLVATNLWLSTGYNIFGFKDKDLSAEEYTAPGIYFRLRFKFDEDLFSGNDPDVNKTIPMVDISNKEK